MKTYALRRQPMML